MTVRHEPAAVRGLDDAAVSAWFRAAGLSPHGWANRPGDTYAWHEHAYEKVLCCVQGSITFHTRDRDIPLQAGDRMVLPPNTPHAATVGSAGCRCIEAPQ